MSDCCSEPPPEDNTPSTGRTVAKGAVLGGVVGGIADGSDGAGKGAVVGGLAGGLRSRNQNKKYEAEQEQWAKEHHGLWVKEEEAKAAKASGGAGPSATPAE